MPPIRDSATPGDSREIDAKLRALVERVSRQEREHGTNRPCSYGLRPDRTYVVQIPSGYEETVAEIQAKYGDTVAVQIVGWVLLVGWSDGSCPDARQVVREALAGRGIDPENLPAADIRIDYESYRGPHTPPSARCRVWVKEGVLAGDLP